MSALLADQSMLTVANDYLEREIVFIVGNSRSGTTMMSHILGRNSTVKMVYELHFFEELWEPSKINETISRAQATELAQQMMARHRGSYARFGGDSDAEFADAVRPIIDTLPTPITPVAVFAAYLHHEATCANKTIPLEQTPRNIFYIQELLDNFPNAKIIHLVRDPRDVILSQKFKWKRFWGKEDVPRHLPYLFWANYHPLTMSLIWNGAIQAAERFRAHPRVRHVRFEDVLTSSEETIREVCNFLNVGYDDRMLRIPSNSSHDPDADEQLGIDPSAAYRWRKSDQHKADLAMCQWMTQDGLLTHGYQVSAELRLTLFAWAKNIITWPFKSVLALLFNFNRTKNLVATLKKRLLHANGE